MTLTLDLTSEQVARLQAEADSAGLALADYVRRRLLGDTSHTAADGETRLAAIDAALGALAGRGISSADFMNEKQTDIAHEEERWRERFRPRSA
jgi:ribonuclease PH